MATELERDVEQRSAVLKKELGLFDLVLAQVVFVVGTIWVGWAAKLGYDQNVFWLVAERALKAVGGVGMGVLIARHLGPQDYGRYGAAIGLAAVAERAGRVRTLAPDGSVGETILDLTDEVVTGCERGLLDIELSDARDTLYLSPSVTPDVYTRIVAVDLDPADETPSPYEARIAARLGVADQGRPADRWLLDTVRWAWRTRVQVRLDVDLRVRLRQRAEEEAARVFAANLRDLLLAAPSSVVIAIIGLLAWQFTSRALAVGTVLALLALSMLGVWPEAMITGCSRPDSRIAVATGPSLSASGRVPPTRQTVRGPGSRAGRTPLTMPSGSLDR